MKISSSFDSIIFNMQAYRTRSTKLTGSNFREVRKKAFRIHLEITQKTKRKPYVRSKYFKKNKIFLSLFWSHLFEKKNFTDLMRRTKLYPCALELIQKSNLEPTSKENPNKASEILHRFAGITPDNEIFFVQIKENKKSSKKWLMSTFPVDK